MKNLVVDYGMNLVKKENKYDDIKLQEIRYGLEAIYLNVSKFIVYFIINAFLGTFIYGLLFLIFYIPLRSFSFGFHAKNSLTCWLLSGFAFIGIPYISTIISFDIYTKLILIISSFIIYYLYSPADTPSRPIINKKLRLKLKTFTIITIILYSIGILSINSIFTNLIMLVTIYQSILISPFFYKIFKIQYNNYLYYGLN